MVSLNNIFPIGIGTFKTDTQNKNESIQGLHKSFELGQNYIDTSFLYEEGKVMELISSFLKTIKREEIFITTKLEPYINNKQDIEKQLNKYLKLLGIGEIDCLMLHSPAFTNINILEAYEEIHRLYKTNKVKYIGVCNTNLETLQQIQKSYPVSIFEGVYNLDCKIYEDIKVLDFCKKGKIKFLAYQPLRRNKIANKNYPFLVKLSQKYRKTQNQILLNRIVKEKEIIPMVKTTNTTKITENIDALNFNMKAEEYQKLNDFRNSFFDDIKVDRNDKGGISVYQLANQSN